MNLTELEQIKDKMKKTIQKELEIWKTAYPKQKELLDKFANKIYFELRFNFLSKDKFLKLVKHARKTSRPLAWLEAKIKEMD